MGGADHLFAALAFTDLVFATTFPQIRNLDPMQMKNMLLSVWLVLCFLSPGAGAFADDDPVFSGPQPGEKLPAFKADGVFDKEAGKPFDVVSDADGKPVFLIFVHKLTRPSVGMTRALMNYAATREKDGLHGAVVWLTDDATETAQNLKRARHALPEGVPIGISPDGAEGPGAYGLNRNVTLTILIADKGKVTANFALVQPGLQADGPKILDELVKVVGGKAPTIAELEQRPNMKRPAARGGLDAKTEALVRSLIQKDNSDDQVAKVAAELESRFKKEPATAKKVGAIARRIIDAGKLKNYGTAAAQEQLKKWADKHTPKKAERREAAPEAD